ncbi:MAG: adenine phosphoribosyltransferase [Bacteroidota bacterium]
METENTLVPKSTDERAAYLKAATRSIPDYPKPGIIFRDLTTIFQDRIAMALSLEMMSAFLIDSNSEPIGFNKFVAVEARGFILAGALSGKLGGGVVLARKPGKLPYEKKSIAYELEYGEDSLEIHVDAIQAGDKVVVVDDLLATGGTAEAACKLVSELGGEIAKVIFLVELPDLKGRKRLGSYKVESVISFEGV